MKGEGDMKGDTKGEMNTEAPWYTQITPAVGAMQQDAIFPTQSVHYMQAPGTKGDTKGDMT
jgi:hypothetical protein